MKELIEKYQKVPVIEYKNKIKKGAVVSVCVQTYNHVNFIKENLEGILMQKTNFPIEILLGEDESNDGTREICMEYAGKYSEKIRLFLHSRVNNIEINGQPTGRFNLLYNLSKAQGKYVAFCEGDDYWTDPYKLQKQVHFMEANEDFAICHHNMQVIYEEKNKERHLSNPPDGNEVTTIEDLAYGNYIFTASCVFRNNLFGEFPDWYAECPIGDYPLHMLNAQFGRIRYIPEVMGGYRVHKGGVWESKDSIYRKNKWVYMLDLMKNQFSTNINKQLTEQQIIVYEDLIHLLGNQPGQCRQYSNKILEHDPFYLSNLRS
ncbi:MAG: glycosyltransferase, partial [Bacteroidales bacterium]|nr:glycosyltransferase [Bacteroidales bacterium]